MSNICHILGCGPSIKNFKPDGNFTIGVNDVAKHYDPDVLFVISTLPTDRADFVRASQCKKLLSHMPIWSSHPAYEHIGLYMNQWRQDRKNHLKKEIIYFSNNTPFVCCSWAYNQGFKEIILWGCDFIDHPLIRDAALEKTWTDFSQLQEAFLKNGVSMFLGSPGSILNLPAWK